MVVTTPRKPVFMSLGDVVRHLGVSADRIRLDPRPGTATVRDVIRIQDRENRNFELVDGILVEKVMGAKESFIALKLAHYLQLFLDQFDLGFLFGADGALRILPRLIRIPDISFISWEQRPDHTVPDEPVPDLAPRLAVEVLSEGNTEAEMKRKLRDYFRSGVNSVWLIDPAPRTARIYSSPSVFTEIGEAENLTTEDVLPGFKLRLGLLFAHLAVSKKPTKRKRSNGK